MCRRSFCLPVSLYRFFKDIHTNGSTPMTTANALTCDWARYAVLWSGTVDTINIIISALQTSKRQVFSCGTDKSVCLCIIVKCFACKFYLAGRTATDTRCVKRNPHVFHRLTDKTCAIRTICPRCVNIQPQMIAHIIYTFQIWYRIAHISGVLPQRLQSFRLRLQYFDDSNSAFLLVFRDGASFRHPDRLY